MQKNQKYSWLNVFHKQLLCMMQTAYNLHNVFNPPEKTKTIKSEVIIKICHMVLVYRHQTSRQSWINGRTISIIVPLALLTTVQRTKYHGIKFTNQSTHCSSTIIIFTNQKYIATNFILLHKYSQPKYFTFLIRHNATAGTQGNTWGARLTPKPNNIPR